MAFTNQISTTDRARPTRGHGENKVKAQHHMRGVPMNDSARDGVKMHGKRDPIKPKYSREDMY